MNDAPPLPSPPGADRYALALESTNEGVYDYDATTGSIYYAPQLTTMLGLKAGELRTADDWTNRIHPDDVASYRHAWRALFKGERPRLDCQYRYRGADGNWRWARQHGIAVRDQSGRVRRVVGATGDITELREAQELQAATAEILRAISRADFDLDLVLRTLVTTAAQLTRADAAVLYRYQNGAYHYAADTCWRRNSRRSNGQNRFGPVRRRWWARGAAAEHGPDRRRVDGSTLRPEGRGSHRRHSLDARGAAVARRRADRMFTVGRPTVDPFTDKQIALVESFADQAVIAIENARLFRRIAAAYL